MNNVFLGSLLQQIIAAEKVLFLVDRFGSSEEWQLHVCELLQTCYHRGSKVRGLIEGEGGGGGERGGEVRDTYEYVSSTFLHTENPFCKNYFVITQLCIFQSSNIK